ncbi:MAG: DUF924 family protein [Spongiibacter marinus]|uniref:DUF924 family protein n=1 Tax=Spongiibacter marinus TaxID=354246 RepID=UPI003C380664
MLCNGGRSVTTWQAVIEFWFDELTPGQWFAKSAELDSLIAKRFGVCHRAAAAAELYKWREQPLGRLAEVIVLDQFSRNIYRDRPQSFQCDPLALVLAQEAISGGADRVLDEQQRAFLYMPYMHSESKLIQRQSLALYEALGVENNLRFARQHADIIERFGRYPHRNAVLGRAPSAEELEFLQQPGSSF